MKPDHDRFRRAGNKVLDVFSDGRIRDSDLMYMAFYTVINAYPEVVLDRIIEYTEHIKYERERLKESKDYEQDSLF